METVVKRYRARDGAPYSDDQAQVIGEQLDAIAEREGTVSPAAVVNAARETDSPLHPFFEWSDARAAEQWRREQARGLIRTIEIQVEVRTPDGAIRNWFRAFPSVVLERPADALGTDGASARRTMQYMPVESVISERRLVDQVVAEAERDLRSWARRYESYRRFAEFEPFSVIFDIVD